MVGGLCGIIVVDKNIIEGFMAGSEDFSEADVMKLISEVRHIKEKSDAVLEATGGNYNIFKILGVNQYETIHSKIIASFLNPKGTHGMKERFLELFLRKCFSDSEFKELNFDCKNALVKTESFAQTEDKNGRIDILICSGAKQIIVENKLCAGDQPNQLKRYDEHAVKNSAEHKILYLTKDGHEASEQSCNGVEYKTISYQKEIVEWLDRCCKESVMFPLVRETITQYINLIKDFTGESMIGKATEEIITLMAKDENIGIASLISRNFKKVKILKAQEIFAEMDDIISKIFKDAYNKKERDKLGEKNFQITYEIKKLSDVNLCILFDDNKNLNLLKCNLSYKDAKITDSEKEVIRKKYLGLLKDIKYQIEPTSLSAFRIGFDPWVTHKNDILSEFEKMLQILSGN